MNASIQTRLLPLAALVLATVFVGAGCSSEAPKGADRPEPTPVGAVGAPTTPPSTDDAAADKPKTQGGSAALNTPRTATISLKNVSGGNTQYGSVTLTDLPGNSTRIDISLLGQKSKSVQPAAIYAGTCATQSAEPQYALNPVVNGRSSTTLAVNIGAILDKAPQALKVREDGTTPNLPFAACGDLK